MNLLVNVEMAEYLNCNNLMNKNRLIGYVFKLYIAISFDISKEHVTNQNNYSTSEDVSSTCERWKPALHAYCLTAMSTNILFITGRKQIPNP